MTPDWLPELKRLAHEADRIVEVWDRFFDLLAQEPEILGTGRPIAAPMSLETGLLSLGKQWFHAPVSVADLQVVETPGAQMLHGGFWMNGFVGCVLYFADVKIGVASIALPSGRMEFARFREEPTRRRRYQPSLN